MFSTTLICWVVSSNCVLFSSFTTIRRFETPVFVKDSKRNNWYHSITFVWSVLFVEALKPIEFPSIVDSNVSLSHISGFQNLSTTVITFVVIAQFDSKIFDQIFVSIFAATSGFKNSSDSIFCPLASIISRVIFQAWVIHGSVEKRSRSEYSRDFSNNTSCLELDAFIVIG